MAALEERVAYLEGRLDDHVSTVIDVRTALSNRNAKIDVVGTKLTARIDAVENKLTALIDALESKLTSRMDRIEAKIDRHFTWLVGIQITVLLAVAGALLRR